MSNTLKPFILLLALASSSATRQSRFSSRDFHPETAYPSATNDIFEGSFTIGRHPVQVSGGIRLRPPAFRVPHFLTPTPDVDFSRESRMPFFFPLPLFTPNTVKVPAATRGQVEEFNKALEEEALEKEKEKSNANGPSRQWLEEFGFGLDGLSQNYVSVRSDKYNYNYTL